MWRSTEPTVAATGNALVVSTPNGQGDLSQWLWSQHLDHVPVTFTGGHQRVPRTLLLSNTVGKSRVALA